MSDKTFERQAELYCMMMENVHDKQFIMAQAKALDHAYERIGQIIRDQIADAEADLKRLTGMSDAAAAKK